MSREDLIKEGQMAAKKNARNLAVFAAKAALRSLAEAAIYARGKGVEEINTAELTAHLEQLIAKQEEVHRIDAEIAELTY